MPPVTSLMPSFPFLWPQSAGHSLPSPGGAFSIFGTVCPRGGNTAQPFATVDPNCTGTVSAPEHLQYIDNIVWGDTTEDVFTKGEHII